MYDPDTNPTRTATVCAAPATAPAPSASDPALAVLEREFGWPCWCEGAECFARHPQTPPGDYDARGDDPDDLREAILLALPDSPH